MKIVLLTVALLAICSPPPKTYTKPEIKMGYLDFGNLCGFMSDESHTLTTEKGDTTTIVNSSSEGRPRECVGTFIFVNGQLTSIEH